MKKDSLRLHTSYDHPQKRGGDERGCVGHRSRTSAMMAAAMGRGEGVGSIWLIMSIGSMRGDTPGDGRTLLRLGGTRAAVSPASCCESEGKRDTTRRGDSREGSLEKHLQYAGEIGRSERIKSYRHVRRAGGRQS